MARSFAVRNQSALNFEELNGGWVHRRTPAAFLNPGTVSQTMRSQELARAVWFALSFCK
jgi:hypothetical protein